MGTTSAKLNEARRYDKDLLRGGALGGGRAAFRRLSAISLFRTPV
jgi:hypothetical protein